jgi:hypothetical protein
VLEFLDDRTTPSSLGVQKGQVKMGASLFANLASILFAQEDEQFIGSFKFFALGAVLLLALGGLLFYLRNKESDE